MGSFSGLGVGLSFVFGFILIGIFAELCYLLWRKKRTVYSTDSKIDNLEKFEKFSFRLCWKNAGSVGGGGSSRELTNSMRSHLEREEDVESKSDSSAKGYGQEGVESELMRLHNLCGPPRFLFTIKEESREDLESEDGKSVISNCKSFGIGSPMPSPAVRVSNQWSREAEANILRCSPPPTFKFLKEAEEKFMSRLAMEEAERKMKRKEGSLNQESSTKEVNDDVSLVKLSKAAAQVMPLSSSPLQ